MAGSGDANPQSGFTLVELLVSLTLLAVILGLCSGALRVASKNWDAHTEQMGTYDMLARAADILHRDAAGLHRVVLPAKDQSPRYLFKGDAGHLQFVALEPPFPTEAGPYYINYSIAPGVGGFDLVRARAPYAPGMIVFPGASAANQVSLLQGPYDYRFSYAAKQNGRLTWYARWPFDRRLPALIRLDVFDAQSGAVAAPATVVSVRADAEVSCLSPKPGPCSKDGELKGSAASQEEAKDKPKSESPAGGSNEHAAR
jgi:general secretion pathway protein J